MDASIFNDDYLYFYAERLSQERSDAETDVLCRVLGIEPGMHVLDLACGHGRIANRLAARGCHVTGLDASPLFLDLAGRDAKARGVSVEYVQGDMRDLPWTGRFDRVVNWFTAYGYFDDTDNSRVLGEVRKALKPDGAAAFELNNRDVLLRGFMPTTAVTCGEDLMVDRHLFDPLTGRTNTQRVVIRDGEVRRTAYSVRLFAFTELRDWLMVAGFSTVSGYGDGGDTLTANSRRMIVTARP
jgi:SAM-dependent methyltransferase